MTEGHQIDVRKKFLEDLAIHTNVGQEVIVTTDDKVRLCLHKHAEDATTQGSWMAPLGVFLTLLAVLVAADFKDTLGLKKEYWSGIFTFGAGMAFLWLVYCIKRRFQCWWNRPKGVPKDPVSRIVLDLKAQSQKVVSHTEGRATLLNSVQATLWHASSIAASVLTAKESEQLPQSQDQDAEKKKAIPPPTAQHGDAAQP